jgi:hypothetical protein
VRRGEWYSWCQRTASLYTGPVIVNGSYALDETPAFVPAGSIIPMKPNEEPTQNQSMVAPLLVWKVYPAPKMGSSAGNGGGSLYEDSGEGLSYKGSTFQQFTARQTANTTSVSVTVEAVLGRGGDTANFAPRSRTQQIELLSPSATAPTPASVRCNGHTVLFVGVEPAAGSRQQPGWWVRQDGPWHVMAVRCQAMAYKAKLLVVVAW